MSKFFKRLSAFFITFLLALTGYLALATTAGLSWDPVTQNSDGSVLTDLAGYKIYRESNGIGGMQFIADVGATVTTYQDLGLADGVHCYEVSAYDTTGLESDRTPGNQCKTIDTIRPSSPSNVRVTQWSPDYEPPEQHDNSSLLGRNSRHVSVGALQAIFWNPG